MVLDAISLRSKFYDWGIPDTAAVLLADSDYACPKESWIAGEFSAKARPELARRLGDYESQESDCDDFAEQCAAYAHECHRRTLVKPRETALAFGEFWYTSASVGRHAINCFVCLDYSAGAWVLKFFEPQGCRIIDLSQEEINSCEMLRF